MCGLPPKFCDFSYSIFDLKKQLLLKEHTQLGKKVQNHTLFMTKIIKIDNLFMTKTVEKP